MFLIKLNGVENPSITRTIAVPATLNFTQFHVALQIAFGWEAGHAWRFEVKSGVEEIDGPHDYLKRGPVRRFPYRCWQEDFLTLSDATVERNGSSHDAIERTAANVKLCDIFKRNPRALQADYAYDFGDGWQHKISFLGAAQPELLRAWKKMYTIPNDTMMCISGEVGSAQFIIAPKLIQVPRAIRAPKTVAALTVGPNSKNCFQSQRPPTPTVGRHGIRSNATTERSQGLSRGNGT